MRVVADELKRTVTGFKHKFPAQQQGTLKVGHLIVSIDGVDVSHSQVALPPLVLGQEGTQVELGYITAPGEPVRHVNIIRGGGAGGSRGGRGGSSMALRGERSMRSQASSSQPRSTASSSAVSGQEPIVPRSLGSAGSDAKIDVANLPAVEMRLGTGGSVSAMALRTYGGDPTFDMMGESSDPNMTDDQAHLRRRPRSVALLPGSGTQMSAKPHLPPTPNWHIGPEKL